MNLFKNNRQNFCICLSGSSHYHSLLPLVFAQLK